MPGFYDNIKPHLKFDETIGSYINAGETVKLIIKTVNTYANTPFIKACVRILSKGNPDKVEFLKRLFAVACKNVAYLMDPQGHEIVFTPKLLMQVGKGDCKKFTTFILCVLKAAGIEAFAKVVSYDGSNWAHIYVIVPNGNGYITLDPVNHERYNQEVNYKKAQVYYLNGKKSEIMSKLSLMGSLGNLDPADFFKGVSTASETVLGDIDQTFGGRRKRRGSHHHPSVLAGLGNDYINGIDDEYSLGDQEYLSGVDELGKGKLKAAVQKLAPKAVVKTVQKAAAKAKTQHQVKRAAKKTPEAKAKKKATRKKIFKAGAKVSFVPMRAAFLALIALGRALEKTPLKIRLADKLAVNWAKNNGASIVPIWEQYGGKRDALAKAISKAAHVQLKGLGYHEMEISGIGVVTATAAAATIVAATPITIAILKALKKDGTITDKEAAHVEDITDAAEDIALIKNKGDVKKMLADAAVTSLTKKGAEYDEGGNQETQADIQETAAEPQMVEQPQEDSENFNMVARTTSSKPATVNTAARTANTSKSASNEFTVQEQQPAPAEIPQPDVSQPTTTTTPAESNNPRNLPATIPQTDAIAPMAKSILGNYSQPITWIKALLYLILCSSIYKINPLFASVTGLAIVSILILSVINLSIKKIKHYGKI